MNSLPYNCWEALTPENALNVVESVFEQPLNALCLPRNSYINRVFEMETHDNNRIIVKFYRPGRWSKGIIEDEHRFLMTCKDHELPVIPPLLINGKTLFEFGSIPFAIFPKKGGRALDELDADGWEEIGRLLGRLHNVSATITTINRPTWTPALASKSHLDTLIDANVIPDMYQSHLITAVESFILIASVQFDSSDRILIHGDCHFGNLIFRPDEGTYIVDFDDSVIGPPVQDLWMLLPGKPHESMLEITAFLKGYRTFRDFNESSLSLIPALTIMRQIHFASWCAIQASEAHFKHHFPHWGSNTYWNDLLKDIKEYEHQHHT